MILPEFKEYIKSRAAGMPDSVQNIRKALEEE